LACALKLVVRAWSVNLPTICCSALAALVLSSNG